jgi:hypothetical protein
MLLFIALLDGSIKRVHVNMDDFSHSQFGTIINFRATRGKKTGRDCPRL